MEEALAVSNTVCQLLPPNQVVHHHCRHLMMLTNEPTESPCLCCRKLAGRL